MQSENKYQKEKIYKIISSQTTDVYYGSTIQAKLSYRMAKHRANYRSWINGECAYTTSYEVVKFEDANIILVESFPCNSKDELTAREQYYIDNHDCVNKQKAWTGLSKKEYLQKYHSNNRHKVKAYREKHREELNRYDREHYPERREKVLAKKREKFLCECGKTISVGFKAKHVRNQTHLNLIKQNMTAKEISKSEET